jgi:hypothetical protein
MNIKIVLTRQEVYSLEPAEMFVAMGPSHWDPVQEVMTWNMTDQHIMWLILQWPQFGKIYHANIQTISHNQRAKT